MPPADARLLLLNHIFIFVAEPRFVIANFNLSFFWCLN